jgi:hypothetical protein
MRRTLLLIIALLLVSVTALSVLVNLRSEGSEPLPEPDPAMPIVMADGSELPLSEVLDRVARKMPLPERPAEPAGKPAPAMPDVNPPSQLGKAWSELTEEQRQVRRAAFRTQMTRIMTDLYGPTFGLAYQREHDGHADQAVALYLSIKEGEPGYARARRRVGWDILARRGDAARGVRYVQQALIADPLNGNCWQDFGRIYARTLGIPVR